MKSVKDFALNAWIQVSSGKIEKRQLTASEISTSNEDTFLGQSYSNRKFFSFKKSANGSKIDYEKL